jgi:hypothetical protein
MGYINGIYNAQQAILRYPARPIKGVKSALDSWVMDVEIVWNNQFTVLLSQGGRRKAVHGCQFTVDG